jgi:hypothetical protein
MPLVRIRALTSIATSTPSNAAMASSVMLMPASQQAERAVLQFQRHAFGGPYRLRDLHQATGPVGSGSCPEVIRNSSA